MIVDRRQPTISPETIEGAFHELSNAFESTDMRAIPVFKKGTILIGGHQILRDENNKRYIPDPTFLVQFDSRILARRRFITMIRQEDPEKNVTIAQHRHQTLEEALDFLKTDYDKIRNSQTYISKTSS